MLGRMLGLLWCLHLKLTGRLAGSCMVACLHAPVVLKHAALLCWGLQ